MSTSHPEFSDTDLSARLDGAFDEPTRARIDAWLREQPEAAARLRLFAADRDALRARFARVAEEPAPQRLIDAVRRGGSLREGWAANHWAQAAAAVGLLVIGGAIGAALAWQWQGGQVIAAQAGTSAGWVQRAAYAHGVYVAEPRHPVEVRAQEEHLSRWLTRRIDIPVKLFDLRDEGFELMGGRLLPDAQGKSAQLMYENAQTKERVTVYLRKPDADAPTAFRYLQQGELGTFYWVEAGAGYALTGPLPKGRLLALAQSIYRQGIASAAASAAGR